MKYKIINICRHVTPQWNGFIPCVYGFVGLFELVEDSKIVRSFWNDNFYAMTNIKGNFL